jgi:cytoskeletal protein CcmA (bactofilin family)
MDARSVRRGRRIALLALAATLLLAPATAVVTAQSVGGVRGTVVVEADRTVASVEAVAGTVVIRGTVTGDVAGAAGTVHVTETGRVGGDVAVAAGVVRVDGAVAGNVNAGAGTVEVSETARVDGDLDAGAGYVSVDGRVDGDVRVGAETVALGPNARVGGDVRYDAADFSRDPDAAVEGSVVGERRRSDPVPTPVGSVVTVGYGLLANLFFGFVLLLAFPAFSDGVVTRVANEPARTAGVGLVALLGVPLVLLVTALTIVGIPLSLVGAVLFAGTLWAGSVYGQYAIAARVFVALGLPVGWLTLVAGLVGFAVLGVVPVLGGLLDLLALLLGLGALAAGLRAAYGRRRIGTATPDAGPAGE